VRNLLSPATTHASVCRSGTGIDVYRAVWTAALTAVMKLLRRLT
jgi:hypothetical protein